ncbi:MAG: 4Fe-4S binding protein, partial [Clostridia bacterium]
MSYIIDKSKCVDCGYCELLCHFGAISETDDRVYRIEESKCTSCGQCAEGCPNRAIKPSADNKVIKSVSIIKEKCKGCSICARNCPVGAASGTIKQPFEID